MWLYDAFLAVCGPCSVKFLRLMFNFKQTVVKVFGFFNDAFTINGMILEGSCIVHSKRGILQ